MARRGSSGGARSPRASSPAAKAQRQILPSSEELLNLVGSRPVAAAQGEFKTLNNIAKAGGYIEDDKRRKYRNLAGEALAPNEKSNYYYIDGQGNYVDTSIYRQSYDIDDDTGELIVPGLKGPQEEEGTKPAPITIVPTSSSNVKRPRTVAAGYDPDRSVLTVVFRDGTWYNYYEVTESEWDAFKAMVSKGKYIYSVLDYKPRGNASTKGLSSGVRKNLYAISRAYQYGSKNKSGGTGKIN